MVALEPSKLSARVRIPAVALGTMKKKGKRWVQQIALERIYRLFELAGKAFVASEKERANHYVELARKVSTRNKATIPTELKQKFCKKCKAFLGKKNAEFKQTDKWVEIKCEECGAEFKRRLE